MRNQAKDLIGSYGNAQGDEITANGQPQSRATRKRSAALWGVLAVVFWLPSWALATPISGIVIVEGADGTGAISVSVSGEDEFGDLASPNRGTVLLTVGPAAGDIIKGFPFVEAGQGSPAPFTEVMITEDILNGTGLDIIEYRLEGGFIEPGSGLFVPSPNVTFDASLSCSSLGAPGCGFANPTGDFTSFSAPSGNELFLFGLIPDGATATILFDVNIPADSGLGGAARWAIRQSATTVPEPGILSLYGVGLATALLLRGRATRKQL
jgi:hypothetical protein